MSQKKVDKYKNSKYSRNSALKKERAEFVLEMAAWILIAVLLVAGSDIPHTPRSSEGSQCEGRYCDGYFCIDRLYFRIIFRQCGIENTYEVMGSRDG